MITVVKNGVAAFAVLGHGGPIFGTGWHFNARKDWKSFPPEGGGFYQKGDYKGVSFLDFLRSEEKNIDIFIKKKLAKLISITST